MRRMLFIVFLVISITVQGQKTKIIVKKDKKANKKEVYSVLKSNKNIKHGSYKIYYSDRLYMEGYYNNNEKDSLWKEYYIFKKKQIANIGHYADGVKIGIWNFFNTDNKLIHKYNHNTNSLVYYDENIYKERNIRIGNKDGTYDTIVARPAFYYKGEEKLLEFFAGTLKYPKLARETGIQGTVIFSMSINTNGKADNFTIIQSVGYGCDEEVLRILQLIPNEWIPSVFEEKFIQSYFILPVKFSLGG